MKLRSVALDPAPGDLLLFRGWKVEVIDASDGIVRYLKIKDDVREVHTQPLQEWMGWAVEAKVKHRGLAAGECVVMGECISGPCVGCGNYLSKDVHLSASGLFCAGCCPASRHGVQKEKKGVTA